MVTMIVPPGNYTIQDDRTDSFGSSEVRIALILLKAERLEESREAKSSEYH
jgi:hypothetical protein